MNAKELRIGNLLDRNGLLVKVSRNTIFDLDELPHILGAIYKPIPLTEEWIKQKTDLIKGIAYHNDKISGLITVEYNFTIKKFELYIGTIFICFVTYIHELQNVIFALTGNELEIK